MTILLFLYKTLKFTKIKTGGPPASPLLATHHISRGERLGNLYISIYKI